MKIATLRPLLCAADIRPVDSTPRFPIFHDRIETVPLSDGRPPPPPSSMTNYSTASPSPSISSPRRLRCPLRLLLLLTTTLTWNATLCGNEKRLPNVVFILADDLGWSDTTLYETTRFYRTPNLERLASRGMTFSRAYSSSPLCSPTRASVLTGLSPARHGITSPTCHLPQVSLRAKSNMTGPPNQKATIPASATRLDTEHYTLAEMLRDHGYATGHFGKWHLGAEPYSPLEHGFDIDLPHHPGPGPAGSYVAPWKFKDFDHDPDIPDEHIEDRMAKEAVAFMKQHQHEPFFLNYWMFSVHAPFDAKQSLIEQYRERVDQTDPQRSPTYAAMIESMDDAVGTLLDTLDSLGIAEETLIVFASDNGGNMYNEVDGTTPTSNTPLRGGKATMYEGGVRGPAILVHPPTIQAGSQSDAVIQSSDFYPTLLEMLEFEAKPDQQFDGVSIVPALQGNPIDREAIFTYFPHSPGVPDWLPPAVSVHDGDWKLIRIFHGGDQGHHRYKLFDLKSDIGEQKNLAAEQPERVRQLDELIEQHLVQTNAIRPQPNPRFDPTKYDASLEGVAKRKGTATRKGAAKPSVKAPRVAGWLPGGTCRIEQIDHSLLVHSSGRDPHLSASLPNQISPSSLLAVIKMKSESTGGGQLFWKADGLPYSAERSERFEVKHDAMTHEYKIDFQTEYPINGIRVDPSNGKGEISISSIELRDADGASLHVWKF